MYTGYVLAAGILMSIFVLSSGLIKHAFTLLAVLLGYQVFKRVESTAAKVWFVVLVLLIALFAPFIYVLFAMEYGWPIDPRYLQE